MHGADSPRKSAHRRQQTSSKVSQSPFCTPTPLRDHGWLQLISAREWENIYDALKAQKKRAV
jgi:hypothetical protein